MCGENVSGMLFIVPFVGSPPRVRGKPQEILQRSSHGRITPACAGKTPFCKKTQKLFEDHPRVCGENLYDQCAQRQAGGSPPRVRGKLGHANRMITERGITPACAGKTGAVECFRSGVEDHPRVCGENLICIKTFPTRQGSPPRVRGKPYEEDRYIEDYRITPACAGKT